MAIMAALSVLREISGMYTLQEFLSARRIILSLNAELAETPPARAISWIPVCLEA